MMVNNGFLVKNDRFSLTEKNQYFLLGWIAPRTELTAALDGQPFPLRLEKMTENVDERFGGSEARACFEIPEDIASHRILKIYACRENGSRRLCFEISTAELAEKMQDIKVFIDDFSVIPKDGLLRLQGWAAAKEPVEIAVLDAGKKKLDCTVERYKRVDVVSLFDEYPVDVNSGFNIEIRPVPEKKIYVLFRAGKGKCIREYRTDTVSVKTEKASRLLRKGTRYLKYNGFSALVRKTYDKAFNPAMKPVIYAEWIRKHLPSEHLLAKQRAEKFEDEPFISIVVPLYKTPEKFLTELTESVKAQSYGKWELILSDGSGADSPLTPLLERFAAEEPRIRVLKNEKQLHIAENTNAAVDAAKGSLIVFADHDDLLTPNALYELVRTLNLYPDTELMYSDEDKIGTGDKYMQPNLKPDFDPDLLTSVNYICHLLAVKKTLIDRVGKLDPAYDGAQDYDFILRCTEQTDKIRHIPKILYHWRFFEGSTAANPESKSYAFDAGKRAVEAHYQRLGLPATVEKGEYPGIYVTSWHWKEQPKVSILIPNKDHVRELERCLNSIREKSKYPDYDIVIIENNSTEEETFRYYEKLKADSRIRIERYEGGFNYSAINNFGAQKADGEYLFLLNNDTEFISPDVMEQLLGYAMRPDTAAAGARLYYEDDTIQHAGVVVGWGGIAGHAFVNQKRGETGYMHRVICQQDYSAVTAACMMVKRKAFNEVGGFTEKLAVAFNDIDLCMKFRKAGYLIVYNPYAELYHYESRSRGLENTPEKVRRFQNEMAEFRKRWPEILRDGDPYYNPNLSMVTQDFSLKRN